MEKQTKKKRSLFFELKSKKKMLSRFRGTYNIHSQQSYRTYQPNFDINQLIVSQSAEDTTHIQACAYLNLKFIDQIRVIVKFKRIPRHFYHVGKDPESQVEIYERFKVTTHLTGGLGNRLFQIAAALWFATKYNRTAIIALDKVDRCAHSTMDYANTVFRYFPLMDTFPKALILEERPENFSQFIEWADPKPDAHVLLRGYFQSYYYVKDRLILKYINNENSTTLLDAAFLHVRRGDYVNNNFHEINLNLYYLEAMRRMFAIGAPRLVICSNDIDWCKRQWMFKDKDTILFADDLRDEVETLSVMAKCRYGGICSNSTFGWWGAMLNAFENTSFVPGKWLANSPWTTQLVDPSKMIELDVNEWFLTINYINLDRRQDRKNLVLWELQNKLQIPPSYIQRFDAVDIKDRGHLGCCASHVHVLQNFLMSRAPLCMVIEDDFEALCGDLSSIKKFFLQIESDFDGLLLGGGQIVHKIGLDIKGVAKRLHESQQTVGYIVTRSEAKKLIAEWTNGLLGLTNEQNEQHAFCIDQSWKKLQRKDTWYVLEPPMCHQRLSYSDIEQTIKQN